jgi:hypothetical protein
MRKAELPDHHGMQSQPIGGINWPSLQRGALLVQLLEASMHMLIVLFAALAPTRWAILVAHFLTLPDPPTIYYGVHGVLSAGFGINDARYVQVVKGRVCVGLYSGTLV